MNIIDKIKNSWCRATAHPAFATKWTKDNPSIGQCLVTALIIQDELGGDIYDCKVGRSRHFYNVINGEKLDLTFDQFPKGSECKEDRIRDRKSLLSNADTKQRYELLKSLVNSENELQESVEMEEKYNVEESNELSQRAKKHKKKSKGLGWHTNFNAGDVEKSVEIFNNAQPDGSIGEVSSTSGQAMGEAVNNRLFKYEGPIYLDGRKYSDHKVLHTHATTPKGAYARFLKQVAGTDNPALYDLDMSHIEEIIKDGDEPFREYPKCDTCGTILNDMGTCPVCDYGETELDEDLTNLFAISKLNRIDE